jgi:hypothetical protein
VKGDALPPDFGGGMTEPEMPHGLEPTGQDMTQASPQKLHPLDRLGLLNASMLAVLP